MAGWTEENVIIDWCPPKFMAALAPGRTIYLTITESQELVSVWPLASQIDCKGKEVGLLHDWMGGHGSRECQEWR